MTWSMGFKAPNLHSMLIDYLDEYEDANEFRRVTDPDLSLQAHPGEITDQQLQNLKQWFVQQIQGDDEHFARWAGKFLSRSPLGDEFALDSEKMIADRMQVEPNPFIRFEFIRLKDKTYLYVSGEEYEVSSELANQLTAKSSVNIQLKNDRERALISELINKGHLLEV
jgi:50S ribosomal protein L16 3-hydroxylase